MSKFDHLLGQQPPEPEKKPRKPRKKAAKISSYDGEYQTYDNLRSARDEIRRANVLEASMLRDMMSMHGADVELAVAGRGPRPRRSNNWVFIIPTEIPSRGVRRLEFALIESPEITNRSVGRVSAVFEGPVEMSEGMIVVIHMMTGARLTYAIERAQRNGIVRLIRME